MSGFIEIIIALIVIGIITRYITYVLSFLSIIPSSLMAFLLLGISIVIVLFVIHRKE